MEIFTVINSRYNLYPLIGGHQSQLDNQCRDPMNNDSCRVEQITSYSHNPDSVIFHFFKIKFKYPFGVTNKKKIGMHFNFRHQTLLNTKAVFFHTI